MTDAAAKLAVAAIVFGYVTVIVSWCWYRWNHPYQDPEKIAADRRLRAELRRHPAGDE